MPTPSALPVASHPLPTLGEPPPATVTTVTAAESSIMTPRMRLLPKSLTKMTPPSGPVALGGVVAM